ncbi:uncharacterized protein Bfra_011508 [Botrytis fragariae]|uniref:Uncharacterized protein n=1 Tax=Botrytis fragariae TaxID=1964551 RepID=A0A8H6EL03_9HELO|nr:uncharacterized protein Bfra_011508 [Botrytis fragariae]KAF5875745.1 hypothetical protein Bfra_011508 [Botrytis fragariae]
MSTLPNYACIGCTNTNDHQNCTTTPPSKNNSSQVFVGHTLGPIVYACRVFLLVHIRSSSSLEPFIGTGTKSFLASEARPQ